MVALKTLDASIISLILLVMLYIRANNRLDKVFFTNKLYLRLIAWTMVAVIADVVGWMVNGRPTVANYVCNLVANTILFVCEPIIPVVWVSYMSYQVFGDESRYGKYRVFFFVLLAVNGVVSIISPLWTHWFFYIADGNLYARGSVYYLHALFCFFLIVYAAFLAFSHRKKLDKRYYAALLMFNVPVVIGSVLQTVFYGVTYTWAGLVISLLIIYFDIQDRSLSTDYLTGLFNRRQFDRYLGMKIRAATEGRAFSAILIDLDRFKQINDRFGHQAGDEALRDTVSIIRQCIRTDDFAARYGGDEFFILLDIQDRELLEQRVALLREAAEQFNRSGSRPYSISFSVGYDIYDARTMGSADDFTRHIDALMYQNKPMKAQIQR